MPWIFIIFLISQSIFFIGIIPEFDPARHQKPGNLPVTDTTGRTIHLDGPADSVFITSPVLWHYLSVNPDESPVVKIPRYMWGEFRVTILGRVFPGLEAKSAAFTAFGSASPISVEEVLQIAPDVALVWDYMSQGLERVKYPGLVKVARDGGDKTKLFSALGAMSGQEARVDRIWGRYWRERQEVIDDISSCKTAPKILVIETVSYTFWSNPNQSFFNNNLESICGFNIGKLMPTRNGNLNLEEFFNLDPDIIYINPYILGDTDIKVWSILEDPRFQGLKAVKNKRVYHMPMGASRLEGPVEAPLSMLWLRMTLHPDQPTSLDIREKIRDTYKFIYDYNITDGEINKWLRLTENSYSSHYSDLFAIN